METIRQHIFSNYTHGDFNHFCTFEYFDAFKGVVREKTNLYIDFKRKLIKAVAMDIQKGEKKLFDYRISKFKEDDNAWYFWIKDDPVHSQGGEIFGLAIAKDGSDFWGKMKLGKFIPTYIKVLNQ